MPCVQHDEGRKIRDSGNNDVKHITMYSHDIEKLKELLNESTDSQSN